MKTPSGGNACERHRSRLRDHRVCRDHRDRGRRPPGDAVAAARPQGAAGPDPARGARRGHRRRGRAAESVVEQELDCAAAGCPSRERAAAPTAWYWAEGTSSSDGRADETVIVASLADAHVDVTITVMPGGDTAPV